jgi:serine/threonine-protein kinase
MPADPADGSAPTWLDWAHAATLDAVPVDATVRASVRVAAVRSIELATLPPIVVSPSIDAPRTGADLCVVRPLGEGGMGEVHLAEQRSLGRRVALKRIKTGVEPSLAGAALLHEARITGALEHPSIVPVHALGVDEVGRPVMVMKRIEGTTLRELLADPEHPRWDLERRRGDHLEMVVRALVNVCHALELAHSVGVIHRDIKPDNVMLGPFGATYLLDWGIAMRVDDRTEPSLAGTPAYLPPEMVDPSVGEVGVLADVYLLGATLHEALTGRPRHGGATIVEVLEQARASAPVAYASEVPVELAELANRATRRDPAERPASVAEFRRGLEDYLGHGASRDLSTAAAKTLLEAGGAEPDKVRSLLLEARLGFAMAQRTWPDNPDAAQGLQRALEAMIERELSDGSANAARELYDALATPRPDLETRIEEARRTADAIAEKAAAAAELERQMDVSIAAKSYAWFFGIMILALAVSMSLWTPDRLMAGSTISMIAEDVGVVCVVLVAAFFLRRRWMANAIARRFLALLLAQGLAMVAASLAMHRFGISLLGIVAVRLLILGTSFLAAAVMAVPALFWLAGLSFAGLAAFALLPERHAPFVAHVTFLGLLAASAALFATGRMRARGLEKVRS